MSRTRFQIWHLGRTNHASVNTGIYIWIKQAGQPFKESVSCHSHSSLFTYIRFQGRLAKYYCAGPIERMIVVSFFFPIGPPFLYSEQFHSINLNPQFSIYLPESLFRLARFRKKEMHCTHCTQMFHVCTIFRHK